MFRGKLGRQAKRMQHAHLQRFAKHAHLAPRIVKVILARHVIAGRGQHIGQRVPDGTAAPAPD